MSNYLLIQNEAEAPVEVYTTLGFSTSRGQDDLIGAFGTGAKQAITLLLRKGLDVFVYCGKTKIEFGVENGSIGGKEAKYVTYKIGYSRPKRTGWVLEHGAVDWTDIGMAIREFVSNAIDQHVKTDGDYRPAVADGRLSVELVNENKVRAKSGYTRVYVKSNDEVRKYFANLGQNFLHFSDNPENVHRGLIPSSGPARIYRCGVFVMEVEKEEGDALFNYNFDHNELTLDECRNGSIYTVRAACANKLRESGPEALAIYLESLAEGSQTFEGGLEHSQLLRTWSTASDVVQANWAAAAKAAFGDGVLVSNPHARTAAQKKGFEAFLVADSSLVRTLKRLGVPTGEGLISEAEQNGIEVLPATPEAEHAVDWAWGTLERANLTFDKPKPGVLSFTKEGDAEGYKEAKVIHLPLEIKGRTALKEALRLAIDYVAPGKRQDVLFDLVLA